ncbi:MAG: PP2C family protein-serine/threonine phosphatase [Eubacterium sp.]|nr:PP2C family protein-serine/threonine phosphatase [Eubacterium sp.]
MEKERDEILWQNEVSANRLQAIGLLVATLCFFVVFILIDLDIYYADRCNKVVISIIMGVVELFMISGVILARRVNYEKRWLKYVLLFVLMLAFGIVDMIFTYNTSILIVIPTVLSIRYFSKKFTIGVALTSLVIFLISAILGTMYGNYDVNNLELPAGTVINMGNENWIADVIVAGGLDIDENLMIKNILFYSFVPKLLLFIVVSSACITIAYHGKNMVLKQKSLTEKTARLGTELELATRIQADMLPNIFPAFPERDEFEIYASMNPAKEVGGDFYDFFMIDEDHIYMAIADVSGKGVPAALFMMASKILLSDHIKMGKSPAQVLTDVNNAMAVSNDNDMFVTVWLGILELSTGKLTAANAGHEYPAIKTPDGDFELYEDQHDFVVGAMEGLKYKEYEINLKPGSKIFVYTDGVAEAMDTDKRLFGTERMVKALNTFSDNPPKEILTGVRKSVDEFVKEAEQFDDITMLCVEYNGILSV